MRQFKSIGLASLLLAVCIGIASFTSLSSRATSGNSHANGGGTAIEGGEVSTFVFNCVANNDGADGHLNYNFRLGNNDIKVDLNCLHITGNRATMAGVVTSVNGEGPIPSFIFEGAHVSFTVEDNGQGKNVDKISDLIFGSGTSCNDNWVTYLTVKGNIDVKE